MQDYYAHAVKFDDGGNHTIIGNIQGDPYHTAAMTPVSWSSIFSPKGHGSWYTGVTDALEPGDRAPDRNERRKLSIAFTRQAIIPLLATWYDKCHCPSPKWHHQIIDQ